MKLLLLALPVLALLPQVTPGNRTTGNDQKEGLVGPGLCVAILSNTTSGVFLTETVSLTGQDRGRSHNPKTVQTARGLPCSTFPPKEQSWPFLHVCSLRLVQFLRTSLKVHSSVASWLFKSLATALKGVLCLFVFWDLANDRASFFLPWTLKV